MGYDDLAKPLMMCFRKAAVEAKHVCKVNIMVKYKVRNGVVCVCHSAKSQTLTHPNSSELIACVFVSDEDMIWSKILAAKGELEVL